MNIKNSTNEDSGIYLATIKNQLGQVSTQTKVNVLSGPKFSKELSLSTCNTQVSESKTEEYSVLSVNQKSILRLECQINAQPKPVIKWFKNDEEIQTNEKTKLENKQDYYYLTIKDCSLRDRGLYRVHAENNCGISVSQIFVDINSVPVIIKGLSNTEITLSEKEQEFEIVLNHQSKPKAEVTWLFSEKQIRTDDSHYSIENELSSSDSDEYTSKLKIHNLSVTDAGSYKCKVKNSVGEVVSAGILSILKGQLFIEKLPSTLDLKEKSEIKFECKLEDSNPKSTVTWLKDGNQLAASKRILISKPSVEQGTNNTIYNLTIQDASVTDSGIYTIKSVSKISTIECSSQVNILSAPKITKDLKPSLQCIAGDKVSLEVTATGKPDPDYKWLYLNLENSETEIISNESITVAKNNSVYSLTINKMTKELKGKYTLRLSNNAGTAEATCNLIVDGNMKLYKNCIEYNYNLFFF